MIQNDSHMHTRFSTDSSAPLRSMLDAAAERGLKGVCVTDHMDLDYPPDKELGEGAFQLDMWKYFPELLKAQEEYEGKLEVCIGVELGLQTHLRREYARFVSGFPFDFVIGSLHLVSGMDPYYGKVFEGRTDAEVYKEAFVETAKCIRQVPFFDVLGHLDYVVRYGRHQAQEYSYRDFADEIDEILRALIESGKGLEVNMAGLKYGLGFPNPHPDVLRRYRELGGEIVTVGSDAHRPEDVAYDFEKAGDILKSCGFRYHAVYREREPEFLTIR